MIETPIVNFPCSPLYRTGTRLSTPKYYSESTIYIKPLLCETSYQEEIPMALEYTELSVRFPTALMPDLTNLAAEAEIPVADFVSESAQVMVASRRLASIRAPEPPNPPEVNDAEEEATYLDD